MICKALIIDSADDIKLFKESVPELSIPIQIKYASSISQAMERICTKTTDVIIIGSGILLKQGFDILAKTNEIPIILVCELEGFDILLKNKFNNVIIVNRPVDTDDIPALFQKALEFWAGQKEKL